MNLGENQVDTLVWAEQTTPTVYQPRGSMTLKALLIKPVSFGGEGYDLKHNTSNTAQCSHGSSLSMSVLRRPKEPRYKGTCMCHKITSLTITEALPSCIQELKKQNIFIFNFGICTPCLIFKVQNLKSCTHVHDIYWEGWMYRLRP